MGLRVYCNRYTHFKDPLVCAVTCPYRTRCRDFALFYDEHRNEVDTLVEGYFSARKNAPLKTRALVTEANTAEVRRALIRLEVKQVMAEAMYIWIGKEDQAELLEHEEVIRRAERGSKAKAIYKVSQEMELRYQLVPRKKIEKAKKAVAQEEERAAARRRAQRPRPVAVESPAPLTPVAASEPATAPTARRTRIKVAGGR